MANESIFKFGDKFGYESPFGDWLKRSDSANFFEDEPPKILDVEVGRDMTVISKTVAIIYIKATKKNFGWITVEYKDTSKVAKLNLSTQDYEVRFDIDLKDAFYENLLFEIELYDIRKNSVEKRSKLSQIKKYPVIYETRLECLCKSKDFTSVDLKYIVSRLRQLDLTVKSPVKNEIGSNKNWLYLNKKGDIIESESNADEPKDSLGRYRIQLSKYDELEDKIFHANYKEKIQEGENDFITFAKYLSQTLVKYKINTCIRKIHFFAQAYVETFQFQATYEKSPSSSVSGGAFYRGRGLKQITHDYNYLEYYDYIHQTSYYNLYMKKRQGYESVVSFNERTKNIHISVEEMNEVISFVPKLATNMKYACDAAGWYWNKKNINVYADKDDIAAVSALVNNPSALDALEANKEINTGSINGYDKREKYYKLFKDVFNYENCK